MFVYRFKASSLTLITIKELDIHKVLKLFNGDIMSIYSTFLNKMQRTRQILRADLIDTAGIMTFTFTISNELIQEHQE